MFCADVDTSISSRSKFPGSSRHHCTGGQQNLLVVRRQNASYSHCTVTGTHTFLLRFDGHSIPLFIPTIDT